MPYLFVLERMSGTHNYTVQRTVEPTHLHVLCSVSVFHKYIISEKNLKSYAKVHFHNLFVPCSVAERNGHNYE